MELFRALAAYCEVPSPALGPVAAALDLPVPTGADHAELFAFQLYPYASVYLGFEGMLGGEAVDRIAGFWRAVGLTPPAEPDHLAALLGLYASFAAAEGKRAGHLRHALLWEHLLPWLPAWLAKLAELCPAAYTRWGELLRSALLAEAEQLGPPAATPLHLRPPAPVGGVSSVLTAVRSGMILTRADLARAARDLGLGLRQGERLFVLESLLVQDPHAVLGWLGVEARRWAEIHRAMPPAFAPVSGPWAERAQATAGLIDRLVGKAREAACHGA